ncbi:hypothetical protein EV2_014779 [Malus domestica]
MSFSFSLARRALPEETCPTRLARKRPIVKQKPDSSPQSAPTSRGVVCSSARKHPRRKFLTRTTPNRAILVDTWKVTKP